MASNRNVLKKYAPQARVDFIQAVTNRAAQFGITKDGNTPGEVQGDLFILNGKAFPRSVANQRGRLIARIAREGFAQVMEAVAYTWFNRFLAIRYMELHHFLDHGCRVLSNAAGHGEPEILEKAAIIDLPGIDRDEIVNLKLDGTKDEVIYRKLLIAQCNDLHRAMPFLFEKIDDETELLLPENLLQSDSIVRKLVNEIDEAEWQEIEIIGWLYQFYISDKKDQVIGKVVKSEDIPAATQLFTPNWIVKYMVENSLGAQWLATYPESSIRSGMEYYIAPAEQTPEVQAQIDAITPKQLDPEAITLIDPAVGSGHILVEAYDLFRAIYLERGYTKREAARAILTKNLFGLDIDDRAAQMAGFALLMKACTDDRSVLRNPPQLNILALQDSGGLDAEALAKALLPQERFELVPSGDLWPDTLTQPTLAAKQPTSEEAKAIKALVKLFDGAKTFGSLITVPDAVMQSLPLLDALLAKPLTGDLLNRQAQEDAQEVLRPLVDQAHLMAGQYDSAIANPPYMGAGFYTSKLKKFIESNYPQSKSDLFSCFMVRSANITKYGGRSAFVIIPNWMFLSSFEKFRDHIFENNFIESLVHNGRGVFGSDFGSNSVTFRKVSSKFYKGKYFRLFEKSGSVSNNDELMLRFKKSTPFLKSLSDLSTIPGSPIAYWASDAMLKCYIDGKPLKEIAPAKLGMRTGDNDKWLRLWHEVSREDMKTDCADADSAIRSNKSWFPYAKGGEFRRWYGNNNFVVYWKNNGHDIKLETLEKYPQLTWDNLGWKITNEQDFFKKSCTWSFISSSNFGVRVSMGGAIFDVAGSSAFPDPTEIYHVAGFLCSKLAFEFLKQSNPTLNFQVSNINNLPWCGVNRHGGKIDTIVKEIINISKTDWDSYETSWDLNELHLVNTAHEEPTLAEAYFALRAHWRSKTAEMQFLEQENNRLFIEAYGLHGELNPEVPLSEITLTCNPHYRYGGDLTDAEREAKLKSDTMQRMADLDDDISRSSSSADKTRMTRERDKLAKQVVELRAFDVELRHFADQRIALDLDDGVKVNYARFGNLLAAKDKVCPKKKGEDE